MSPLKSHVGPISDWIRDTRSTARSGRCHSWRWSSIRSALQPNHRQTFCSPRYGAIRTSPPQTTFADTTPSTRRCSPVPGPVSQRDGLRCLTDNDRWPLDASAETGEVRYANRRDRRQRANRVKARHQTGCAWLRGRASVAPFGRQHPHLFQAKGRDSARRVSRTGLASWRLDKAEAQAHRGLPV